MKLLILAAAFLLAFTACSPSREANVITAHRSPGGTKIVLTVGTCNADLTSRVEETEDEVRVLVTARNNTTNTCADGHTITLSKPLGDRLLIDDFDGETLAVTLDRSIPDAP